MPPLWGSNMRLGLAFYKDTAPTELAILLTKKGSLTLRDSVEHSNHAANGSVVMTIRQTGPLPLDIHTTPFLRELHPKIIRMRPLVRSPSCASWLRFDSTQAEGIVDDAAERATFPERRNLNCPRNSVGVPSL